MRRATLLLAGLPKTVNASLHAKLNFVFLNGIAPAAKAMGAPTVTLANPRLPAWSVLIRVGCAKANPAMRSARAAHGAVVLHSLISMQHVPESRPRPEPPTPSEPARACGHLGQAGQVLKDLPTIASSLPNYEAPVVQHRRAQKSASRRR